MKKGRGGEKEGGVGEVKEGYRRKVEGSEERRVRV